MFAKTEYHFTTFLFPNIPASLVWLRVRILSPIIKSKEWYRLHILKYKKKKRLIVVCLNNCEIVISQHSYFFINSLVSGYYIEECHGGKRGVIQIAQTTKWGLWHFYRIVIQRNMKGHLNIKYMEGTIYSPSYTVQSSDRVSYPCFDAKIKTILIVAPEHWCYSLRNVFTVVLKISMALIRGGWTGSV